MPEREIRRTGQEGAGTLNEGLNVRLLQVRPQVGLLTWPMLNQGEARRIIGVLQHGDAPAVGFAGLDCGDELGDLTPGPARMLWKRAIADEYDCFLHTGSNERDLVAKRRSLAGQPGAEQPS